ncbi:hypothetical protein ACLGIH_30770 [Streptomyces sp. HMX87]|uniref:hypothetical protein n=1 Tax=Streptomyces sp. HMX87 TaxID=3390849 RepID=UPI003A88712A
MSAVRTVPGDVLPGESGVCDAHDHGFLASPWLPGRENGRRLSGPRGTGRVPGARRGAVVRLTPYGLGGRAADPPPLSRETEVRLVASTGLHQDVRTG